MLLTLYILNFTKQVGFPYHSRSPAEEKDEVPFSNSAPEIRDVFGDSDDEEPTRFGVQNEMDEESNVGESFKISTSF